MEIYTNKFHSGHLYLRLGEAEELSRDRFDRLIAEHGKPLQTALPSNDAEKIRLLKDCGFILKRRCFETEAGRDDLLLLLPAAPVRIVEARRGTREYGACARRLYEYYRRTHEGVNPLTASCEEFETALPELALFSGGTGAFVEDNEIAYLYCRSTRSFPDFAGALLKYLFARYERVFFEADDTDPAATALRAMFRVSEGASFDTYVKPVRRGQEA